ncbi:MAG: hypothetical protein ACPL7K_07175, partial [Armatimonadota bacterium]
PRGSSVRTEEPPPGSIGRTAPLALEGYCPVSILEIKKWVKGHPAYQAVYDGQTYLFANAQAKQTFESDPAKYVPALGGDCVVAFVKTGKRVRGNIRHAALHNGRLFLFSTLEAKNMFLTEPDKYANADLALGGFCPVCAAGGSKTPGNPEIATFYKGVRYLFPSKELRAEFLAHPEKYALSAVGSAKPDGGSATKQPSSGSTTREPAGSGSGSR